MITRKRYLLALDLLDLVLDARGEDESVNETLTLEAVEPAHLVRAGE